MPVLHGALPLMMPVCPPAAVADQVRPQSVCYACDAIHNEGMRLPTGCSAEVQGEVQGLLRASFTFLHYL